MCFDSRLGPSGDLDPRSCVHEPLTVAQSATTPLSGERARVAIIGGTGYGGAELIRLLLRHPAAQLVRVTSIDRVGARLEDVHTNLHGTGLVFEEMPAADVAKEVDILFLALPHKVSAKLGDELKDSAARIIDLSGDFRLRSAAEYAEFYGGAHPFPQHLGTWTYGLPELHPEAIAKATRVASPGCFATTIALGLLPLAKAGLLQSDIQTVAATGSSGSGAYASEGTHHPLRANNLKVYKTLNHQHRPEIEQTLRDAGAGADIQLHFVPVSAPLTRGILANSFVSVPESYDLEKLRQLYRDYYGEDGFVRVLEGTRSAEVVAVKGSMWVDLSLAASPARNGRRQVVITTAADNLVKGGAGQAVQSMNLMLGLHQRTGIDAPALWP